MQNNEEKKKKKNRICSDFLIIRLYFGSKSLAFSALRVVGERDVNMGQVFVLISKRISEYNIYALISFALLFVRLHLILILGIFSLLHSFLPYFCSLSAFSSLFVCSLQ